jgi:hypothetical protein
MNSELDKLRKEMTREEFIKFAHGELKEHNYVSYCPKKKYDLSERCSYRNCEDCYRRAVKDIQFKDDIEQREKEWDGDNPKAMAEKTTFSTGAWRNNKEGKGRYDLLPWSAIHELAKHCQDGAVAHGERNIDLGIPLHDLMDSALRHLSQYMQGKTDENHLRSAFWNIAWAVEFEVTKPELQDLPARMVHND